MEYLEVIEISSDSNEISTKLFTINQMKNIINNFNKREFYIIDSRYSFDISSIIIKKECILLKLDFLRAIIFKNKIFLIDIKTNEFNNIKYNLNEFLKNFDESKVFHLYLLDFLFTEISNFFDKILNNITPKIYENIEIIKSGKYIYKDFILLQSKLLNLEYRIKELKNMMDELLNNKSEIKELIFDNSQDLYDSTEDMIENYSLKFEDLSNDISRLTREMDNIQKIINIDLAKQRNNYAVFSIYISIVSLSVSLGSFIGSMFGMNLRNNLETSNLAFIVTFLTSLLVIIISIKMQNIFFQKFQ